MKGSDVDDDTEMRPEDGGGCGRTEVKNEDGEMILEVGWR